MKKLFVLSAIGFLALSSFTTKETKKETARPMIYKVYCNGVYAGAFTCDGCNVQAVAIAMCNG